MKSRSLGRQLALQVLYQAEVGVEVDPRGTFPLIDASQADEPARAFGRSLARGVIASKPQIDRVIGRFARNWSLSRMPLLDRNILRLGVFELLFGDDLAPAIAIDEAVELAKRFGTAESGSFVNGLLDKVREHRDALREEFPMSANA